MQSKITTPFSGGFLAVPCGKQDVSSLTRDQSMPPVVETWES